MITSELNQVNSSTEILFQLFYDGFKFWVRFLVAA